MSVDVLNSDNEIRQKGLEALELQLGTEGAKRFLTLIGSTNFDYTQWRTNLHEEKSIQEYAKIIRDFVSSPE